MRPTYCYDGCQRVGGPVAPTLGRNIRDYPLQEANLLWRHPPPLNISRNRIVADRAESPFIVRGEPKAYVARFPPPLGRNLRRNYRLRPKGVNIVTHYARGFPQSTRSPCLGGRPLVNVGRIQRRYARLKFPIALAITTSIHFRT